jgi:hypothetical protein
LAALAGVAVLVLVGVLTLSNSAQDKSSKAQDKSSKDGVHEQVIRSIEAHAPAGIRLRGVYCDPASAASLVCSATFLSPIGDGLATYNVKVDSGSGKFWINPVVSIRPAIG